MDPSLTGRRLIPPPLDRGTGLHATYFVSERQTARSVWNAPPRSCCCLGRLGREQMVAERLIERLWPLFREKEPRAGEFDRRFGSRDRPRQPIRPLHGEVDV